MSPNLRILVIDDDQRMSHTLKDILTISGHEVVCSDSAKSGIKILEKQKFDCVLTDVKMPDMDGVSFYSKLHEDIPVSLLC